MEKLNLGNIKKETDAHRQEMGENTSEIFGGRGKNKATVEFYNESPKDFADIIKERLSSENGPYTLLDIGSAGGEFLGNLIKELPEYKFKTIGTDIDKKTLFKNPLQEKIVSSADKLPLQDKSVDLAVLRYVLHLNNKERQKEIIKEISRIIKKFAIIQHAGADSDDPESYREKVHDLYDGEEVPKIKREEYYFSSADEIEGWMNEYKIPFKRLKEKLINNVFTDVLAERFKLNKEEVDKMREVLGDKNYLVRTTWVVFPQENETDDRS